MTSDNDLRRASHINAERLVTSEARAALRERVARAIADEDGAEWGSISDLARSMYSREAERAIDIVLEEAARVAKRHNLAITSTTAADVRANEIAAAIRALTPASSGRPSIILPLPQEPANDHH